MELPGSSTGYGLLGDKSVEFYKDPMAFVNRHVEHDKSRVFVSRFLMKTTVFVASNEATRELMNEKKSYFEMGYKDYFHELYGDNVLFTDGEEAENIRTIIRPIFCQGFLQNRFNTVETITKRWMDALSKSSNEPISIYMELKGLTTQLVLALFLDIDVVTTQSLAQEVVSLSTAHWHGVISVPFNSKVPLFTSASYRKAIAAKERLLAIIQERQGNVLPDVKCEHNGHITHNILLAITSLIPKSLASLLTSFVTSSPLWFKEYTDKQGCMLDNELDCLLLEIERCWPPFIGGRRIAIQDCDLAGYQVPAGHAVLYVTAAANRDPNVFPNPDAFDPERWKTCNAQDQHRVYTFGGGSRKCPAIQLVRQLMKHVCCRMAERFYWEVPLDARAESPRKWFPVSRQKELPVIRFVPKPC